MTNANFNLGRYLFDGNIVIGRPDSDSIDIVSEGDDLPRVLASPESSSRAIRRIPAGSARMFSSRTSRP